MNWCKCILSCKEFLLTSHKESDFHSNRRGQVDKMESVPHLSDSRSKTTNRQTGHRIQLPVHSSIYEWLVIRAAGKESIELSICDISIHLFILSMHYQSWSFLGFGTKIHFFILHASSFRKVTMCLSSLLGGSCCLAVGHLLWRWRCILLLFLWTWRKVLFSYVVQDGFVIWRKTLSTQFAPKNFAIFGRDFKGSNSAYTEWIWNKMSTIVD